NVDFTLQRQLATLEEAPARVVRFSDAFDIADADLVIDSVIACGLDGEPRGAVMAMIAAGIRAVGPVLSLDVPSGVNADTGESYQLAVLPTRTLALALPKHGLVRHPEGF